MISLEEVRSTIGSTFKTLHTASYPTIPVNYPNYFTVDIETFSGLFFVNFCINWGDNVVASDITGSEATVHGNVSISTVGKVKTGTAWASGYSTMLLSGMLFKTINGINYTNMKSVEISPFPGFYGVSNIVSWIAI